MAATGTSSGGGSKAPKSDDSMTGVCHETQARQVAPACRGWTAAALPVCRQAAAPSTLVKEGRCAREEGTGW